MLNKSYNLTMLLGYYTAIKKLQHIIMINLLSFNKLLLTSMLAIHLLLPKNDFWWHVRSTANSFPAKDATVMLTMNLWAAVGLCNGATGTVIDIIYDMIWYDIINHQIYL